MLWYALYPLRGTTQPPSLSPNHPIRRAFYRHGRITAHHWLVAMLVSVAIAMSFSYPTVVLSGNPTAGFVAYPHHFWSTVKIYEGDLKQVDMEMRQVWIHGDYMSALNKSTLLAALDIQTNLIGVDNQRFESPGLDGRLRDGPLKWGFHSPLIYWNNSARAIRDDDDIRRTIEKQSSSPSSLNVALRPASVFAGKKFEGWKLEAADAVVITLMNRMNDTIGHTWHSRMQDLNTGVCQECRLFPADGKVTRNRVYEFSFPPLSLQEHLALTIAYSCMAIYVLLGLRRLKAFHSRFGLVVTAITQVTCSILASITVCGMLRINLANVPQSAYPFVVLVVGLENMFRLINAIVAYPATMATDLRIANALGDVGPVSMATALQNILILSFLSRFVSPGVAAFCAFACIATLFDVFFLLTFFVAVLNVDIRRLELQDALARTNQTKTKRGPSPAKSNWFDALIQGRLPISTRMAGTVVTTTFILSLNYHFFERHESVGSIRHLFGLARDTSPGLLDVDTFSPLPMNATLTTEEWMLMQDLATAREVMRLAKPGADRFSIQVFEPLIVVLAGADRTEGNTSVNQWLHALRLAAVHHFYPLLIAVVFIVTFVAVLMSILLYSEALDGDLNDEAEPEELSVSTLCLPHRLDIVKIFGQEAGHFVTLGLDRTMCVTIFDRASNSYQSSPIAHDNRIASSWPIQAAVVDDTGNLLAFQSTDGTINVYDRVNTTYTTTIEFSSRSFMVLLQFVRLLVDGESVLSLVALNKHGQLYVSIPGQDANFQMMGSTSMVLNAIIMDISSTGKRLIVTRMDGTISAYVWHERTWRETCHKELFVRSVHGKMTNDMEISLVPTSNSEVIVVTTTTMVLFVDAVSLVTIGQFDVQDDQEGAIRLVHGFPVVCPTCGSLAYNAIGYLRATLRHQECHIATLSSAANDATPLCVRNSGASCRAFEDGTWSNHILQDSGAWQVTKSASIIGLRKMSSIPNNKNDNVRGRRSTNVSNLRRRTRACTDTGNRTENWRAYKFGLDGRLVTRELPSSRVEDVRNEDGLYVSTAGPTVNLQSHSVVIGFGNVVHIIRDVQGDAAARRDMSLLASRSSSTSKRRLTPKKAV